MRTSWWLAPSTTLLLGVVLAVACSKPARRPVAPVLDAAATLPTAVAGTDRADAGRGNQEVRMAAFGDLGSSAAELVPNRFWRTHQVYAGTSYTFPHIPRCLVAWGPDKNILPLAGRGDRLGVPDPVGNFNRVAGAEKVQIGPADVQEYARFVVDAYIASFDPKLLVVREGDAKAILAGVDVAGLGGLPAQLPIVEDASGYRLTFYYWEFWWRGMIQIDLVVHRDGTIEIHDAEYGRVPRSGSHAGTR